MESPRRHRHVPQLTDDRDAMHNSPCMEGAEEDVSDAGGKDEDDQIELAALG